MNPKNKTTLSILCLTVLVGIMIFYTIPFVSASLGTFKQGECVPIITVLNVSGVNISILTSPSPSAEVLLTNQIMTKIGNSFNYTFCNTSKFGTYTYGYCDSVGTCYSNDFTIGDSFDGLILIAQVGMIGLFLAIAFSFSKEKWKMRGFFFMASLFMALITLNSIRIMANVSPNMNSMGEIGLILGIIVVAFMALYILIYYTIEVFSYFKKKKGLRWEMQVNPN